MPAKFYDLGSKKYEFAHLLNKLRMRNLEKYRELVSPKHAESQYRGVGEAATQK
jgi:hypothetical protein